jgi:hypothetical protein
MRLASVMLTTLMLAASCAPSSGELYDADANAWKQLEAAAGRARADGKRVLAIVGGNW